VTSFAVGDKVLLAADYCGHCSQCQEGRPSYCEQINKIVYSGSRADGTSKAHQGDQPIWANFFGQSSFATHALVTERNAIKLSKDADLHALAAISCGIMTGAGSVFHALPVEEGTSFAVIGTGAVGIAAIMAAAVKGAKEIIAIDRVPHRLELAKELGATSAIHIEGDVDMAEEIRRLTGDGCHVILDTTGSVEMIRSAVTALRTRGVCGFVSASGADLPLPFTELLRKGKSVRGIMGGDANPKDFLPQLIALYESGRFPFDRLIRHYPFEQINAAIDDMQSGKTIKPVITFA